MMSSRITDTNSTQKILTKDGKFMEVLKKYWNFVIDVELSLIKKREDSLTVKWLTKKNSCKILNNLVEELHSSASLKI
jgi:hypothetical protein